MTPIRNTLVALATAALASAACAQATTDAPPAAQDQRGARLAERFKAADANGDGKLTRDEAKAKMPRLYRHFDEIDANHTGTITLADIAAYAQAHRGTRKPAATP